MTTKNGVAYDLGNTPFSCMVGDYEFRFSSGTHMKKFVERLDVRIPWMRDSMQRRFKFDIETDLIATVQLYMMIESRGFYLRNTMTGEVFRCAENITLNGTRISARN